MKREFLEDVLKTVSRIFVVLIIAVLIGVAFSGVRIVKSGEVAMVLRFGKLVGDTPEEQVHKPGLLFCFPGFIDEVVTVSTDNVMQQDVYTHYTDESIADGTYMLTGDNNVILINAMLKYKVSDPVSYALKINEMESIIDSSVRNVMLENSARTDVDVIMTSGKKDFQDAIFEQVQDRLDTLNAGIAVQALELTSVTMPKPVKMIYEGVNAATIEASTLMEEAQQYWNTVVPSAEAYAQNLIADANSTHASKVADANMNLTEFWGVLDEYKRDPEVVRTRIYSQKLSTILDTIGSIRVVQNDDSVIIIKP
ncbi:MAG: protease modulator HflK [Clostridia bacterium]|nr:protease modulator HflK [Clostridia bacterium]